MDEQQKRVVVLLKDMLQIKENRLLALKQTLFKLDLQRVKICDEQIAVSAAIKALSDEITKWEMHK